MPDAWIEHTAVLGDRWDTLAYRYYGDAFGFMRLIEANSHIPIRPFIAPGTPVVIPLIEPDDEGQALELPPWKQ